MSNTTRLDKLLANMGYGSRKEIRMLATEGLIERSGQVLRHADSRVVADAQLQAELRVNGEALDPLPGLMLMLHKPIGFTCSHKEVGKLVYELLPERWRRREPPLSTVGRLDKETSGLLLITDDGALLHRIIAPRNHLAKRYRVMLERPLRGDEAVLFSNGQMMLDGEDKPLLPAELEVTSERSAFLTLYEGRYHQVRRMFAATGNHVTALHRDRIGALALPDDLPQGEFRLLDEPATQLGLAR